MKWMATHIVWILQLMQIMVGITAAGTDLFSTHVLALIVFFNGILAGVIAYIKANPPPE